MTIERDKETITIKLDASLIDLETVQEFADYFSLLESNAKNKGTQEQVEELAWEFHKDWLEANRERLSRL